MRAPVFGGTDSLMGGYELGIDDVRSGVKSGTDGDARGVARPRGVVGLYGERYTEEELPLRASGVE